MRAFLGLEVPESARRALSGIRARLRENNTVYPGLRWTRPENLHLTVRFLGDISESLGDMLTARLRGSLRSFGPVFLQIDSVAWFPPRRPSVLAAGLSRSERLDELFRIVENDAVALGLPAESRTGHPHITVARLRERNGRGFPEIEERVGAEFWCQELILFQSRLLPTGAHYSHYGEISLGGAPMIDAL